MLSPASDEDFSAHHAASPSALNVVRGIVCRANHAGGVQSVCSFLQKVRRREYTLAMLIAGCQAMEIDVAVAQPQVHKFILAHAYTLYHIIYVSKRML